MADAMTGPTTRCPWCSAALPAPDLEQCPSCGAMLVAAADTPGEIKGLTTLDTEAILRARNVVTRPRGRLFSFITGDVAADDGSDANPASIAPPDSAVRREMLRLQLEAEAADLQAEVVAHKADELARRGIHLSELGGPAPEADIEPVGPDAGAWPPELVPDEGEHEDPPARG
jgi:hypothetical protein